MHLWNGIRFLSDGILKLNEAQLVPIGLAPEAPEDTVYGLQVVKSAMAEVVGLTFDSGAITNNRLDKPSKEI
eukprot:jgi/Picsp_1/6516/NSC_03860-R1_---NA---